ncbi:MAG: lipid IV(A) 3-deoxy-D-manno-octulosonic acid transferase, partial [Pseudohongiellaceae bacterium]
MSRLLYSLLLYLGLPLIVLRLLYRSIKAPAYLKRWHERFGFVAPPSGFDQRTWCIWIHAVSVGESLAAVPLVKHLQKTRPLHPILITTMTPTGSARVIDLFGEKVSHVYLPYDLPGAVSRFLKRFNPQVLLVMETELWPNLLHHCHRNNVKVLLANARLSEKSARGYRRLGSLTRTMLQQIDLIAAQSNADAQRLISLGAPESRVKVTGSLKFDMEIPALQTRDLPSVFQTICSGDRAVWIAASTREGEEEKVLRAFRHCLDQQPELLLVLVPRHPERFNEVARLCISAGYKTVRRSTNHEIGQDTQIFLGDSMGEMWFYFALADIAFIGGSLVNTGCHNV